MKTKYLHKYKAVISRAIALTGITLLMSALTACDKSESYSDLLRDEEKAVNWYLAQQRVEVSAPEKGEDFEVGPEAPFYRMDKDGTVYMQVINRGDMQDRPQDGDKVYFRFLRRNIKSMWLGLAVGSEGNMDNLGIVGPTFFFYGNTTYPQTTQFGTGIQIPLDYLGYYSEVNLVVKSYSGFTGQSFQAEQSSCIPFLLNVKYYRPEY